MEGIKDKLAKWEQFVSLMGNAEAAGKELLAAAPVDLPDSAKQEALTRDIDNALESLDNEEKDNYMSLVTNLSCNLQEEEATEGSEVGTLCVKQLGRQEQESYQQTQFCRCVSTLLRQQIKKNKSTLLRQNIKI